MLVVEFACALLFLLTSEVAYGALGMFAFALVMNARALVIPTPREQWL